MDKCPNCGNKTFSYDDFEDMYRCEKCEVFLYPHQINKKDNPKAGFRNLSET